MSAPDPDEIRETRRANLHETGWLAIAATVMTVLLLLSVLGDVAGRVGGLDWRGDGWKAILTGFSIALVLNLPKFILIGVLGDFASLFGRTSEGEVFSVRNLRTLRNAGTGLITAAIASAVIVPTLMMWIGRDGGGLRWHANDLALGVAAMGAALLGLSHVFAEGIRIKTDSDQII